MKISELIEVLAGEINKGGKDLEINFFMFAGDFGGPNEGVPIYMKLAGYYLSKPHRDIIDIQLRFDKASMRDKQILCCIDFTKKYNEAS